MAEDRERDGTEDVPQNVEPLSDEQVERIEQQEAEVEAVAERQAEVESEEDAPEPVEASEPARDPGPGDANVPDDELGYDRDDPQSAEPVAPPEGAVTEDDPSDPTPRGTYMFGEPDAKDPFEDEDDEAKLAEAAREGVPSAKLRQKLAGTEANLRSPLTQRPVEEGNQEHPTAQNAPYQTGDTLPGERSLHNDEPAFQVAVTHVPGTPLPESPEDAGRSEEVAKLSEASEKAQADREKSLRPQSVYAIAGAVHDEAAVYATKGNIVHPGPTPTQVAQAEERLHELGLAAHQPHAVTSGELVVDEKAAPPRDEDDDRPTQDRIREAVEAERERV